MSTCVQGVELKYPTIDKQSFAVFRDVNDFNPYLLRSHTNIIVLHLVFKALLIHKEPGDQRGNCLSTLQEYDLEIKLAKLVKGQELCKLAAEALDLQWEEEEGWENEFDLLKVKCYTYPHQPIHGIMI